MMILEQCEVSLDDLVNHMLHEGLDHEEVVRKHLDQACLACLTRLMELRTLLDGAWMTLNASLN